MERRSERRVHQRRRGRGGGRGGGAVAHWGGAPEEGHLGAELVTAAARDREAGERRHKDVGRGRAHPRPRRLRGRVYAEDVQVYPGDPPVHHLVYDILPAALPDHLHLPPGTEHPPVLHKRRGGRVDRRRRVRMDERHDGAHALVSKEHRGHGHGHLLDGQQRARRWHHPPHGAGPRGPLRGALRRLGGLLPGGRAGRCRGAAGDLEALEVQRVGEPAGDLQPRPAPAGGGAGPEV
mmetsp:Transcript_33453/g.94016  ORF Transcript_33453/g.94016 Transcript_33453/m.94016 type:complete len:236 (-) Transcript_33453:2501-3208(-)